MTTARGAGGEAAGQQVFHCEYAWLGGQSASSSVSLEVRDGVITEVRAGVPAPSGSQRLAGLTLPAFANAHSHAFHRALRGRSERRGGSFWTWRDEMYALAERLTPDSYRRLARAVYGEMALAGYAVVGEFHYLHHGRGGRRYDDPNAMGEALCAAAEEAGVRLVLLDACYLQAEPGRELEGPQLRFGDGSAEAWAERVDAISPGHQRVGAAVHSMRAVAPESARTVAAFAAASGRVLHVHCAEQRREVEVVRAAYGAGPVRLLTDADALRPGGVAVHATHLDDEELAALVSSGARACFCPTTERDLGDGIGPARRLAAAGVSLCLGSDSQAVIDAFEEMRGLELDERLAREERGVFSAEELLAIASSDGYGALGEPTGGRLRAGALADFVTVGLSSPRLAGIDDSSLLEGAVFAAGAGDVSDVVVGGRRIVEGGRHVRIDVADELARSIADLVAP